MALTTLEAWWPSKRGGGYLGALNNRPKHVAEVLRAELARREATP